MEKKDQPTEIIKQNKLKEFGIEIDTSFDYHVHIGQYYDTYFQPYEIIKTLHKNGIKGCWFSSTTSCIKWSNESEREYITQHIVDEVNEAYIIAKEIGFEAKAFYWLNLDCYKLVINNSDMTIEEYFESSISKTAYYGIKLHTKINYWDMGNAINRKILDLICAYAKNHKLPVLLHSGYDESEDPRRFDEWFGKFPEVMFVLAHLRPPKKVIEMMIKHNNVWTDTSFAKVEWIKLAFDNGLSSRVLYGTDFPINREEYN